jgi:glyoxylase-like metal-dependent hydrolase (beta-lactamase superfamily II)
MSTVVLGLKDLLESSDEMPEAEWDLRAVRSGECLSYIAWNSRTKEALVVDPKDEDLEAYRTLITDLPGYLWLGVIDTHTHADHISAAPILAEEIVAPLIMHQKSSNTRVGIRIAREIDIPTHSGGLKFLFTPGHTPDAMTVVWGPFAFLGDTVVIGDSGRDDLPGGDSEIHFESLQKLKATLRPELILLPGHDSEGGRASTWQREMISNPSLIQTREDFIRESNAFDGPSPTLLRQSLRENMK